jgi:hypothetical protein
MAGLDPRLSGSIFLYEAHGIDSNGVWTLATFRDTRGGNAVRRLNGSPDCPADTIILLPGLYCQLYT